jgi:hypothetical protein
MVAQALGLPGLAYRFDVVAQVYIQSGTPTLTACVYSTWRCPLMTRVGMLVWAANCSR